MTGAIGRELLTRLPLRCHVVLPGLPAGANVTVCELGTSGVRMTSSGPGSFSTGRRLVRALDDRVATSHRTWSSTVRTPPSTSRAPIFRPTPQTLPTSVAARACNRSASESAPRLQTWARWPGYPATQLGGQLCGSEFDGVAVGCRPIPAHRRAPKLPDDRPRSLTVRIYEAVARGLRRSAMSGQ